MEQVIYADVLFVVNFSMDFLSLYVTARISHSRIRVLPMIFGAAIGALYATAAVFSGPQGMAGRVLNVAAAWLMCYVSFNAGGILATLRQTLVFYGVGFLLGGIMTALYGLLGRISSRFAGRSVVINGDVNTLTSSIPLPVFFILAAAAGGISFVMGRLYDRRKSTPSTELEVGLGRRTVRMNALCDSGNLLREPLGGLPVILITESKLRELLPTSIAGIVLGGDISALSDVSDEIARRMRVIPLRGVASNGVAIGFTPDRVLVDRTEKKACICCTGENSYGGRDALLPSALL